MSELISSIFKLFDDEILHAANDSAILSEIKGELAFSTDSFTLSPVILDDETNIGKLSVCGSANDALMVGAKPLYMSLALIIEEGFSLNKLQIILKSIHQECQNASIRLVCGDTKVVPKGRGDEIYINTSVIGQILAKKETKNIRAGLAVLVSGDIGRHGAAVLVARNELEAEVKSDCKCLKNEVLALFEAELDVVAMRDATRGGLSAVLNEWAQQSGFDILVREEQIAIKDEVAGICELFGFEPYELANEGTFVLCVAPEHAARALELLKRFNQNAAIIGEVLSEKKARVILENAYGARRFLEVPKGELLPRIC